MELDNSIQKVVQNKWTTFKPEYFNVKKEDIAKSDYPKLILGRMENDKLLKKWGTMGLELKSFDKWNFYS